MALGQLAVDVLEWGGTPHSQVNLFRSAAGVALNTVLISPLSGGGGALSGMLSHPFLSSHGMSYLPYLPMACPTCPDLHSLTLPCLACSPHTYSVFTRAHIVTPTRSPCPYPTPALPCPAADDGP